MIAGLLAWTVAPIFRRPRGFGTAFIVGIILVCSAGYVGFASETHLGQVLLVVATASISWAAGTYLIFLNRRKVAPSNNLKRTKDVTNALSDSTGTDTGECVLVHTEGFDSESEVFRETTWRTVLRGIFQVIPQDDSLTITMEVLGGAYYILYTTFSRVNVNAEIVLTCRNDCSIRASLADPSALEKTDSPTSAIIGLAVNAEGNRAKISASVGAAVNADSMSVGTVTAGAIQVPITFAGAANKIVYGIPTYEWECQEAPKE